MSYKISGRFLATLAVSAGSAGLTTQVANAADFTAPQYWNPSTTVTLEGGILRSKDSESDKVGVSGDHSYAAIALRKAYAPDLDWRIGGAYRFGASNSLDFSATDGLETLDFNSNSTFNFQTLDFDLGKHFKAKTGSDIRVFGGVRGLRVAEKSSFGMNYTDTTNPTTLSPGDKIGISGDKVGESTFYGLGPRGGVEFTHPFGQTWGLVGGVSGAAIFGQRSERVDGEWTATEVANPNTNPPVVTNPNYDASSTSWGVIGNINVQAGVQWMPMRNSVFTIGYQVDYWTNLRGFSSSNNDTFHGPFLRVDVKY